MSKRFTDTNKFKNPWRRKMPMVYRELWEYMLCECDHAGVWRVDLDLAAFMIGAEIDPAQVEILFIDKIVKLDHDKWFIPSFIEFQYGDLNENSKPHQSVIKILKKHQIDPISLTLISTPQYPLVLVPKGIDTLKEKDKEKDKAKDKEKDPESLVDQVATAWQAWCDTLDLAGIPEKHMSPTDETTLASAIKRLGFARTVNALIGKRFEVKQNGYDPKSTLSIGYCVGLSGKNAAATPERLENLALAEESKLSKDEANRKADHNARYGSGKKP